jgi:hypothetical protein
MLLGNEELQPPQEKEEEHNKESDSRLILFDRKLFKLVNNVGDALCLFFSVSSFLTELHSQEKYTFPGEWSKYINMTNSNTFSDSNVIQDLAEFLCTICEAVFNTIVEYYDFVIEDDIQNEMKNDIENDIEKKRQKRTAAWIWIVWWKSKAENKEKPEQKKCQVNELLYIWYDQCNKNWGWFMARWGSHACSKQDAQSEIVIVQNNYDGLTGLFVIDNWIFY